MIVDEGDAHLVFWNFDATVTNTEDPGPFQIDWGAGFANPLSSEVDGGSVKCQYDAEIPIGAPWRVIEAPSELIFVGGGVLEIPESGVTEAP